MKRYESYKDSGLKWLGAMPGHWESKRAKYLYREIMDRSSDGNEVLLSVSQYTGVTQRVLLEDEIGYSLEGYRIVMPGDLVINIMLAWMGALGISNHTGIVSPAYCVYRIHNQHNPKFFGYLFQTPMYLAEFARRSHGIVESRWRMYTEDFYNVVCIYPSREEQDVIVAYLDQKLAETDRFIANKERLIELLKEQKAAIINRAVTRGVDPNVPMKQSRIDELGEIPVHWEVKRLKYIAKLQNGLTLGKIYTSEQLVNRPYLRVANVQDGYLNLSEITTIRLPESEVIRYELRFGDVLMTEGGDFDKLGRGFIWESQIEGCLHQNHVFAVRPDRRYLLPRFLAYLMSSSHGKIYFTTTSKQTTNLASTNSTTIKNFLLPLPPIEEQEGILRFLECETSTFDIAISKAKREIQLIKEFRTTLISEVVTGKIDVRTAVKEEIPV